MTRITMQFFVLVVASSAFVGTALWWPGRSGNDFASVQMTPRQEGPKGFMSLLQVDLGVKSERRSQTGQPKRQDPYAEPAQGESTADEWCQSGGGSDPLCDANADVIDLEAEMKNIVNVMSCRRAPSGIQCLCKTDPGNPACTEHKASYETIDFENQALAESEVKKKRAKTDEKASDEKKAEAVKAEEEHQAAEKEQAKAQVTEGEAAKKTANAKETADAAKEARDAAIEQAKAAEQFAAEAKAQAEAAAAKAAEAAPAEKAKLEAAAEALKKKAELAQVQADAAIEKREKAQVAVKEAEAALDSAAKEEANAKEEAQAKEEEANKEGKAAAEAVAAAEVAEKKAVEAKAAAEKAETDAEVAKKMAQAPPVPDTGCTPDIFQKRVASKVGNSDFVFQRIDKDKDGKVSQEEFKGLVEASGCLESDAPKLFKDAGAYRGKAISQAAFKDTLGATKAEVRRRIMLKYGSADAAFTAGDTDGDQFMSKWEVYEQCELVAEPKICKKIEDEMPENMNLRQYKFQFMGISKFKNAVGQAVKLSEKGLKDSVYQKDNLDEDSTGVVQKISMPNGSPTYEVKWNNGETTEMPEDHVSAAFKHEMGEVVQSTQAPGGADSDTTGVVRARSITGGTTKYRIEWDTGVETWVSEKDLRKAYEYGVGDVVRLSDRSYQASGVTEDSTGVIQERVIVKGVATYKVQWANNDQEVLAITSVPQKALGLAYKLPLGSRVELSAEGKKHAEELKADVDSKGTIKKRTLSDGIANYEVTWDSGATAIVPEPYLGWEFGTPPSAIVREDVLEEAGERLKVLISRLQAMKEDFEKKGKLDPELERSINAIIGAGGDTAAALEAYEKMSPEEQEAFVTELESKANALMDSTFVFQTEVHPHGYKWWRFRWEFAYVEAWILIWLVICTMVFYWAVAACDRRMDKYSRASEDDLDDKTSILVLFHVLWTRVSHQMAISFCISIIVWAFEEVGLFWVLVKWNVVSWLVTGTNAVADTVDPKLPNLPNMMHLPTTDTHWINTIRAVNVHLFIALMLYYVLMYYLVYGAFWTLMAFIRHESPEVYEEFMSDEPVEEWQIYQQLPVLMRSKALAVKEMVKKRKRGYFARVLTSDWWTGKVLGCMDKKEDFVNLKQYYMSHAQNYEGFDEEFDQGMTAVDMLKVMPLYPYVSAILHDKIFSAIMIRWQVWVMIVILLLIQSSVHYHSHLAVMEILPATVAFSLCCILIQYLWVRRDATYVVDPKNQAETHEIKHTLSRANSISSVMSRSKSLSEFTENLALTWEDMKRQDAIEHVVDWLQQLNFFFLCYACSRLLTSYFFWRDYFWIQLVVLFGSLCLLVVFILIGTLSIVYYTILHAVPPYVSAEDVDYLQFIARQHSVRSDEHAEKMDMATKGSVKADPRYLIP